MSALDALHVQCEKRGWRLAMTGSAHWQDGSVAPLNQVALIVDGLEVRGCNQVVDGDRMRRELLARWTLDGVTGFDLEHAAVELARSLALQGLAG